MKLTGVQVSARTGSITRFAMGLSAYFAYGNSMKIDSIRMSKPSCHLNIGWWRISGTNMKIKIPKITGSMVSRTLVATLVLRKIANLLTDPRASSLRPGVFCVGTSSGPLSSSAVAFASGSCLSEQRS